MRSAQINWPAPSLLGLFSLGRCWPRTPPVGTQRAARRFRHRRLRRYKDFQPWQVRRATPERFLPKSAKSNAGCAFSEKSLEKIGTRASSNARQTTDGLTEAIASALFAWADRFRQGASSFGDQSTAFGKDAARYGSAALTRITEETEQRPLMAIVVALGVGILIGMAASGRT